MNAKSISDRIEDQLRVGLGAIPATFEEQLRDIDFWLGDNSFSVKAHYSTHKYGNYVFELKLLTRDGQSRAGNFEKCEARYSIYYDGTGLSVYDNSVLKPFVDGYKGRITRTTNAVVLANRAQGRHYEAALLKLVPCTAIEDLAIICFALEDDLAQVAAELKNL